MRMTKEEDQYESNEFECKGFTHLHTVLRLNTASSLIVLSLVLLSLREHALNLLLRQTSLIVCDDNPLRLSGGLVGSVDVQDTVGVDVEGNLNLRNASGCGRDTSQLELAEQVAVLRLGSLSLEDLDEHTRLVVGIGGEDLGLLGRDGGVSLDKRGHDTASGLDTHGKRSDVEEKEVLGGFRCVTGKDGSLDGGTVCNGLIRVDLRHKSAE